ncbi:uncharacterized protein A4U43_C06F18820 [Asparagus officinalis]|uniref:Disease resistance R13L4/SHOC-2-like LRR domain-containing protein n=1 Tax=Asparagus officinalis TaxID=4686 RepID=A0A5P1ETC6_ASPOF|nr:piriformospora indica-insensitive protein 2-like [Asparagus officinalis]ONK67310.1 uncharacterized protein A4U43_C06F18820 [Asparagus officinalis]
MAPSLLLLSLLLSLLLPSNCSPQPMQAQELSSLFNIMGSLLVDGPSWAQLHPHPCTDTPWPGVTCELVLNPDGVQDPFLHVTRIHIGPDLATPPCKPTAHLNSLRGLPFLKTLSLFSCFVSPSNATLSPSLFSNSSSLQQLVLKSNNGLVGEIPKSLSNLRNLRVLSLSQNNLTGPIPKEIGGLARLQQLDLSYNSLAQQIPETLSGLTSLTIFDLSYNKLEGQLPNSLGRLSSLRKLDLSSNLISGKIPWQIGELENLALLDLGRNNISGPIPETLSGLKNLEYFLMESNPIRAQIPLFLGDLRSLTVIGLSGCGLIGPIPAQLGSLENLAALALDRNKLNGSVPRSLGSLSKLGQLNLSQNELSGEIGLGQDFVVRMGNRIDLRENKGLCAKFENNRVWVNFEAPPCVGPQFGRGRGSGVGPSEREAEVSLCCLVCFERIVFVCSLVVLFFVTSTFS